MVYCSYCSIGSPKHSHFSKCEEDPSRLVLKMNTVLVLTAVLLFYLRVRLCLLAAIFNKKINVISRIYGTDNDFSKDLENTVFDKLRGKACRV